MAIKKQSPIRELFERKKYTDQQLSILNKEIEAKYMVEKTFRDGTTGRVFQEEKYMIDRGAMTKDGRVGVPFPDMFGDKEVWKRCKYQEERNLLDQWFAWLGRKQYGNQRRLEELEQYATMTRKHE